MAKSALSRVDRTQSNVFLCGGHFIEVGGKKVSFSFSKETQKTTRLLFSKERINIFARKSNPPAESVQPRPVCGANVLSYSKMLRNSPDFGASWT